MGINRTMAVTATTAKTGWQKTFGLQDRFPDATLRDGEGLVKLVTAKFRATT